MSQITTADKDAMGFFRANRTFLRVMVPAVVILCLLALMMASFSYWQAKNLYQDLQKDNLASFLNTSRNVLAKATPEPDNTPPLSKKDIRTALQQTSLPQGVTLFVFSPSGRVFYQKGGADNVIKNHMAFFLKKADSASHSLITPHGETIVGMHVPSRDVFMAIYSQNTFATTPQSRNIKSQVLVIVPLAIMATLLCFLVILQYSLFTPLSKLANAMRALIAKQDFTTRVSEKGSGEIRDLSNYFNQMLAALQRRDEALHAYSDDLEAQVQARTSELKNAQEKIIQQERLAAIGEFASSIVHELRNPLSAIKMGIERLTLSAQNDKNKRSLELAKKEVNRLDGMLRGILDFAANRPTNPQPIAIDDLLDEMEPFLAATKKEHQVDITHIRDEKDKTCTVVADKAKIEQVLLNLLKNAAECAPKGSSIHITCKISENVCTVDIQNQGAPIPEDVKPRLFEPFYTTKKGGTGLGLPTSKKLLEEMDGGLTIQSDESGTTVTLTLPSARKNAALES